jgi:hypothetical protein
VSARQWQRSTLPDLSPGFEMARDDPSSGVIIVTGAIDDAFGEKRSPSCGPFPRRR